MSVPDLRGMYECGCDPKLVNYRGNRGRFCPRHAKPYVPKNPPKAVKPPLMTATEVNKVLIDFYGEPWATFEELRVRTGWGKGKWVTPCDTKGNPLLTKSGTKVRKHIWDDDVSLDFFAMHTWPSQKFKRIAFEVKVTRSDFKNEVKKPWKREPGLKVSNQFYFVTPPGLLAKEEVFPECGLMEAQLDGTLKIIKKAPLRNEDAKPTWAFVAAIARRASRGSMR